MFCNESTSRLVLRGYKLVRMPLGVSRYDSRYIIKTVKHPKSVMVWGDFSGVEGVYIFFPKKVTMRGDSYLRVLDHHMLPFRDIRRCNQFMQDGDPAHRSRVVKKRLKDNHVPVLECPRNSPDLYPIENAWNYMKNKVQEAHSTNIQTSKEVLMKLWVPIYAEYFRKFVESMPNILHNVIKSKAT